MVGVERSTMNNRVGLRCDNDLRLRIYAYCQVRNIMKIIACDDGQGKTVHIKIPHLSRGIRALVEEGLRGEGI